MEEVLWPAHRKAEVFQVLMFVCLAQVIMFVCLELKVALMVTQQLEHRVLLLAHTEREVVELRLMSALMVHSGRLAEL